MRQLIMIIFLVLLASPVRALDVFACEPEWGSLVHELAGDVADITIATTAFQDPHTLQARPSLIAAIRSADLVVCTGADLEIGWLPLLLRRAGNSTVQLGNPGHFMAADFVRKLEVPAVVDRSQGDIHPHGNPHVHLNPRNLRRISTALGERLTLIDPSNAARYESRLEDFQARLDDAIDTWEEQAAGLAGLKLVSNHRSFSYLVAWLDMDIVATLEPMPGIPASGAQLAKLLEQLTPNPPAVIIRTPFANERPSQWLSDRINVPQLMLPYTIGGTAAVVDLFTLFDESIRMLREYGT